MKLMLQINSVSLCLVSFPKTCATSTAHRRVDSDKTNGGNSLRVVFTPVSWPAAIFLPYAFGWNAPMELLNHRMQHANAVLVGKSAADTRASRNAAKLQR